MSVVDLVTLTLANLTPALALVLALLVDHWLGEPVARWHPVVWMGNYLSWAGRRVQHITRPQGLADHKAFWLAALYWCAGAAIVYVAFEVLQRVATQLPAWLTVVLLGVLLKPLLAWAMLKNEVRAVELALAQSLDAGRERLSWLVSRDTTALSEVQVRESALESLAENLNDSVVAPIFWFVLLGLPGAVLYRYANTADAMWGYKGVYRGQNWEWAGKWAARVDDGLNWIPARLTGLFWALTCGVHVPTLGREAGKTPSPNSGWSMAAMALALNIRLGKPGVYVLNPDGQAPQAADVSLAISSASKVLVTLVLLACAAIYLRAFLTS